MMTAREAAEYAPQWGSYMTSSDPGACMYGDPCEPATAAAMISHIDSDCLPIAERGSCCGTDGPCEADKAELGRLRAFLESVA